MLVHLPKHLSILAPSENVTQLTMSIVKECLDPKQHNLCVCVFLFLKERERERESNQCKQVYCIVPMSNQFGSNSDNLQQNEAHS